MLVLLSWTVEKTELNPNANLNPNSIYTVILLYHTCSIYKLLKRLQFCDVSMVVYVKRLAVSSPICRSIFLQETQFDQGTRRGVIPALYKGGSEQEDEDISLHGKHNNS